MAIRHSKSQTTLDGCSLLSLPPLTTSLRPVSLTPITLNNGDADGQEPAHHSAFVYRFLEAQARGAAALHRQARAAGGRQPRSTAAETLLRLLREVRFCVCVLVVCRQHPSAFLCARPSCCVYVYGRERESLCVARAGSIERVCRRCTSACTLSIHATNRRFSDDTPYTPVDMWCPLRRCP